MHSMIELHPKPDALHGLGLPAIPYPVALPAFQAAVANDGELPLADMLRGLQRRAADPRADWQRMAPAMARLAELLAPDDARPFLTAQGEGWWLEVGPVDLGGPLVTLQRGDVLLAALAERDDGRLRMAAYHPLDGRALEILLALAHLPAVDSATPDRRNCWERAHDAAAGLGQHLARERGSSHLAWWARGLGLGDDGGESAAWRAQRDAVPRSPACVVAEIATFHMASVTAPL